MNIKHTTTSLLTKASTAGATITAALYYGTATAFAQTAGYNTRAGNVQNDPFGLSGTGGLRAVNQNSLVNQVTNIINIITILLALIAVCFMIYAGIQLITSRGDEKKQEEAKKILINAVIGFVLIAISGGVVSLVVSIIMGAGSQDPTTTPLSGEYVPSR
ncbi:hypothetical protein COW46_03975 [Candidatus Gracilibacteria bacterium CG17_big_fil_post_rev_8_21_14_2_50_48_13]|nr:MAG: hypothetical protein COW46_03975 [Candidatus Gracilibacteria bacterium CG17_big_fil_post_rev_8_21_14_2_50_48_13]